MSGIGRGWVERQAERQHERRTDGRRVIAGSGTSGGRVLVGKRNRHTFDAERARAAAIRSAEARRLKALQERGTPPTGGNEEGGVPPEMRLQGVYKVSDSSLPADWTIRDAQEALRDPKTPAYVQQKIREWLYAREREQAAEEPVSVGSPRAHDLAAVLKLAADAGVDVDAPGPLDTGELLKLAEGAGMKVVDRPGAFSIADALRWAAANGETVDRRSVLAALRQVRAGADRVESSASSVMGSRSESETAEPVSVEEPTSAGPSGPAVFGDDGSWALIVNGKEAAEIQRQEAEAAMREGERLMGGWRDPDIVGGDAA